MSRDGRDILKGVSLELRAGTTTLLLGLNGAGKTTLLRALYGGIDVRRGMVSVEGRDPRRDRGARRRIGLVPQDIALYQRLTVLENVTVFAALAGRAALAADRAAILAATGLTDAAHRLVATMSGGMQRRANMACALVCAPRLLLLDEPTVGLDVAARRGFGAMLRRLSADTGAAILLTTHDLDESEDLADRVAILHEGRLIANATPTALIAAAFGPSDMRIDVVLADAATPSTLSALREAKFSPLVDGAIWRGFLPLGAAGLPPGAAELGLAIPAVREMRIRRPGLEDAFSALTARRHP